MMPSFQDDLEEAFVLWDCDKEVLNEYEAFKAGAKWMAERCADKIIGSEYEDELRQFAKELDQP